MSRVLVTGAAGFVGQALVAHLVREGFEVRALSRRTVAAGEGVEYRPSPDLAGEPDWPALLSGVDAVVHAAAIAHTGGVDEAAYDAINHRAVLRLAEAAKGRVDRIVFLSSVRAQSGAAAPAMLAEADTPRPADAYGRSKLAAEEGLRRLGVPAVILRPTLVAGPNPSGNLAALLRLARLPLPLRLDGLAARRSIVARSDLARAVTQALESDAMLGETYIVAHPEPISVGEMFAALRQGLGKDRLGKDGLGKGGGGLKLPMALLRALPGSLRDKLLGDLVASPAKLMATGFTPLVTPREAMREIGAAALR